MNPAVVGLSLMVAAADVFDMSERARAGSTPTGFSRTDHSFPHADPSRAGPSHPSSHLLVRHCNGCVTLVDNIFCLTGTFAFRFSDIVAFVLLGMCVVIRVDADVKALKGFLTIDFCREWLCRASSA